MTKEKSQDNKEVSKTIFDDVFRTMAEKFPQLFVALINEAFGTDYPDDIQLLELKNEHYVKSGKIITDALFDISGHLYHLECQSKKDNTMVIRMFEYDTAIAIENAEIQDDGNTHIRFPDSCVVYIRNHSSLPDAHELIVDFPDGQSVKYSVPIIKAKDYSVDEIFQKKLLAFLPYYILRYEHFLKSNSTNKKKTSKLLKELGEISNQLADYYDDSESRLFDMKKLILEICSYVIPEDNSILRKVDDVMGGKVLELESERLLREGRAEGRTEGENLLARLISVLLKENRTDDVQRVTTDPAFRTEMYQKYHLL